MALVHATAGLSAIAINSYQKFRSISATPTLPSKPGEARLVFDRPGVAAVLSVRIDEANHRTTTTEYWVTLTEPQRVGRAGFTLVLTGKARASVGPPYDGGPPTSHNGCWSSLNAVPDDGLRCVSLRSAADGRPSELDSSELQLISGYVDARSTVVTIRSDSQFHTQAGKRTYCALPSVGANYTPKAGRNEVRLTYGDQTAFLPSTLTVELRYRKLEVNERVESASPELATPGHLAWVDRDAAMVGATGSLVDVVKEETGQSELFLLGVLLGSLVGLAQALVAALYKEAKKVTKILRGPG